MTDSTAPSFAEKLAEARTELEIYEAAQLGDIMWMQSSLRDISVDAALRAKWTLRIEQLDRKIQISLGEFGQACGAASVADAAPESAMRAVDEALNRQAALWQEIEETETQLAAEVPAILDSDWRPFPPHLKPAREGRRAAQSLPDGLR
jgi:hypothetical protein